MLVDQRLDSPLVRLVHRVQMPRLALVGDDCDDKADGLGLVVGRVVLEVCMAWVRTLKNAELNVLDLGATVGIGTIVRGDDNDVPPCRSSRPSLGY